MRGLIQHFKLTLLLNLKSRQALIYGYLVPILFLIAFASIFRASDPPLLNQLGQLLTISVLGGACFGMPTGIVADRERGIWRRYRLLPVPPAALLLSTMAARVLIVLAAALLQIALAALLYAMPLPRHPLQLSAAFLFVTFAFLGIGLIIAMLADSVPAVQALGQAIFLPMIMIGGVGVPLGVLPHWAQRFANFLPGKYAVDALQSSASGAGLAPAAFDLLALLIIGLAACAAAALIFRWDAHEKLPPKKRAWILLALAPWLAIGLTANLTTHPPDQPATSQPAPDTRYLQISPEDIASVDTGYEKLPPDTDITAPISDPAPLDEDARKHMQNFQKALDAWPPAKTPDPLRRVRNLLEAASVADLVRNSYEGNIAYVILAKLRTEIPKPQLEQILTFIILHPQDDSPILAIEELGVAGDATKSELLERTPLYAKKLLGRLTGKITAPP